MSRCMNGSQLPTDRGVPQGYRGHVSGYREQLVHTRVVQRAHDWRVKFGNVAHALDDSRDGRRLERARRSVSGGYDGHFVAQSVPYQRKLSNPYLLV